MALQKEYTSTFGMVHPEAYFKILDIRFTNRATYREIDLDGEPLPERVKQYSDVHVDVGIWHDKSAYDANREPIGGFTHRYTYNTDQGNMLDVSYTHMKETMQVMEGAIDI